jgi:excinuclease ABC subunit C
MVEPSIKLGLSTIQTNLALLPDTPGVYRMLGEKGEVLYVGKAKSLKKRVSSYTRIDQLPKRIQRMVSFTRSMQFVTTRTEAEALLVEAGLIKSLKPHYNILLRDDKSFPYIAIDMEHPYPRIAKYRGAKKQKTMYFGPYPSATAVNEVLEMLQKAFLLRPCRDNYFANRHRPCLQYDIKRCSGPCVNLIDRASYATLLEEAVEFLEGRNDSIHKDLVRQMEEAAASMNYEHAAQLRDRIRALTRVNPNSLLLYPSLERADAIALHREGGWVCIQLLSIRGGQAAGTHSSFIAVENDMKDEDILQQFLIQHYTSYPPPQLILLQQAPAEGTLLADALSQKEGKRIELAIPQRGEKMAAVEFAIKNARDALGRKLSESGSQKRLHESLAKCLGMATPPDRIEIYDNSHIMGAHSVGVMVVAGLEGFQKNQYRKYNIKTTPGDDFGMMREVMQRRFRQAASPSEDGSRPILPDLMIIDGGVGQVNAVVAMLQEAGLTVGEGGIAVVGMAKGVDRNAGREQLCIPGREPFRLPEQDPALYYLQRLRDEAHRYAIGTHRSKRSKAMVESALDHVPGIGPRRKKALLQHFGSGKAVREASMEELLQVDGINEAVAEKIHAHFRN